MYNLCTLHKFAQSLYHRDSVYTSFTVWQVMSPAWRFNTSTTLYYPSHYPHFRLSTLNPLLISIYLSLFLRLLSHKPIKCLTPTFNSKFCGAIEKLNSLNYLQWSSFMIQHLASTEINDIVRRRRKCPPAGSEECEILLWKRNELRAKGVILGACNPVMTTHIESAKTSAVMWTILSKCTNLGSADTIKCQQNLHSLSLKHTLSQKHSLSPKYTLSLKHTLSPKHTLPSKHTLSPKLSLSPKNTRIPPNTKRKDG